MANVHLLPDVDLTKRKYLLDTNFLFCIFADADLSTENITRQKKYLAFFEIAKKQKLQLFVTSFAISEYFNRVLRYHFGIWQKMDGNQGKDFKRDFRPSETCDLVIKALRDELNEIKKICEFLDDSFSLYQMSCYVPYLSAFDFNGSLFAHVSIQNDCVLVTEDRDFNAPVFNGLNILTANDTMYRTRKN